MFAALLHVYIFVMESVTWASPRTRATFGTTVEEAEVTKLPAFNQGFYNLFLAIVTGIGIVAMALGHNTVGVALVFAGIGRVVRAGLADVGAAVAVLARPRRGHLLVGADVFAVFIGGVCHDRGTTRRCRPPTADATFIRAYAGNEET